MSEELIKRLRAIVTCGCDEDRAAQTGREAADLIESLTSHLGEEGVEKQEVMGGADAQPALVASLPEPWEDTPLQQRMAAKIVRGNGSCWDWSGTKVRGRSTVYYRGSMVSAPRLSKVIADRKWPEPHMQACHSCDNPACMNSAHIWWGTNTENSHDAVSKGRLFNQKRTHCVRGHPLSGDNLRYSKGHRICRRCAADRQRRWRATTNQQVSS